MYNFIDEKFWLAIAFLAFALLIYKYVWSMLSRIIGNKSDQIVKDLHDAKVSKEKAEVLLQETQKQYDAALENSKKILGEAEEEARKFITDSKLSVEDEIKRKVDALSMRIKNEEEKAIRDIKSKIISLALKNAKEDLKEADKEKFENVVKKSIDDISKIIH